eukprot:959028-Rhodomonas_salina.1
MTLSSCPGTYIYRLSHRRWKYTHKPHLTSYSGMRWVWAHSTQLSQGQLGVCCGQSHGISVQTASDCAGKCVHATLEASQLDGGVNWDVAVPRSNSSKK